jgi:hypothetical protein
LARGFLAALVILTSLTLASASPANAAGAEELDFLAQTNAVRAQNGLGALQWDEAMANVARGWSSQLAAAQSLSHNGNLVSQVNQFVTNQWTRLGENVGFGPTVSALQGAFMNSPPHRANIMGDYNRVGIGVVRDGNGTIWVTLDFMNGPDLAPAAPPAPPAPGTPMWFFRNSLTTGVADSQFPMGVGGDKVMACDWNGDGVDTPGIFRNGTWYVTDQLGSGGVYSFGFGGPGDVPVCGDWTGTRKDSPGVYRNGVFYLRNTNTTGVADLAFAYGDRGDLPAVGDWNGDGITTVGVYRSGMYYLRNTNTGGFADMAFAYGDPGDRPLTGDWNGDGTDTIGIWRNGALYLKNSNATGIADYVFGYGNPGDAPIIGDWNHNGTDKLGVVRGT